MTFSPKWNLRPFAPCSSRKDMDAVLFIKMLAVCSIESLCVSPFSLYAFSGGFCRFAACTFAACAACDMCLEPARGGNYHGLYIDIR